MKRIVVLLCLAFLLCGCGTDTQSTTAVTIPVQPETTIATEPMETTAATVPEETTAATETVTVPTTVETLAPTAPQELVGAPTYVVNTNTGKFHYPDCSSVPDIYDENKQFAYCSREELMRDGFEPCGRCHP